jgi:DNA-binding NarL/FixJ family response regulator
VPEGSDPAPAVDADPVMAALDRVTAVGRDNVTSWMVVMERVEQIRRLRADGIPYTAMQLPEGTRLVDALDDNQQRLQEATTALRNASILQLRAEGLTSAEIARRFGVSRQWVSRLLADLTATGVDSPSGVKPR